MGLHISTDLYTYWSPLWKDFLLGGRLSPLVLLSHPQILGLWSPPLRDSYLRAQHRDRVRVKGHGRAKELAVCVELRNER